MNRTAFRELLVRYVNGTASEEEKAIIDHWYELLYDASLPALQEEELDDIEQEMWTHIEKSGDFSFHKNAIPELKPKKRNLLRYAAAAAIVASVGVVTWALFLSPKKSFSYEAIKLQHQLQETVNNTRSAQKVNLGDGSYVILQPSSKIAYPKHFEAGKREVYMEGQAFFQVAKDPSKPFYVYAHELVTKVLGTSFDVQALPDDNTIKVIVHTGKVTVYQRKLNSAEQDLAKSNATIITPNQQVVFNRRQASIAKAITVQPQMLSMNNTTHTGSDQMVFTGAPASQVLAALQKAYGINMVFDEEMLSHCSFTGTFTNETFFEKINLVCKAIEATYEQADGQLIITGHDCEQ
jgi:transmembrane sensor